MSPQTRILVVDDYAPFRETMRSMLSRHPELVVIAEASDGLEAVHKAEDLRPDLVLIDLNMPRLNGLEATRRIRKLSPNSKIILVSLESSIEFIQAALAAGGSRLRHKNRCRSSIMAGDRSGPAGSRVGISCVTPVSLSERAARKICPRIPPGRCQTRRLSFGSKQTNYAHWPSPQNELNSTVTISFC